MPTARYDGLAEDYVAFVGEHTQYYRTAAAALARLLGPGSGSCLDLGCGAGHFIPVAAALGWTVTGADLSADQLEHARERAPGARLVLADGTELPFASDTFDAAYSTFTHTDFDDFAAAMHEARRVLRPGGRLVYLGNHPAFVGPTQEHRDDRPPRLHPGYRRAGRWDADEAPGSTPGGWRARLGSYVHLPVGPFLEAFRGFTLADAEELDDGGEYPKTIALAWRKPRA